MGQSGQPAAVANGALGASAAAPEPVPGEPELDALLTELLEKPEDWNDIVGRIEATFTNTVAIMVLDMSGFSRQTLDRGITAFLLMIHQMQLLAMPSVEDNGGTLIKAEADNLFCVFDSVDDALAASREITVRLETANLILPKERRLYASIGIGYGPVLNIGNKDLWGAEMNIASKLGEDVAQLGQIMMSEAAKSKLDDSVHVLEECVLSVSGMELKYFLLES
ncbi:MAG: adenylate/guanylate cyclase domain-containing protein [Actinomycetota bacterium]|nr:adenylate/guanylate cyclase domain-containing protein [Actinomycetota bacterium]